MSNLTKLLISLIILPLFFGAGITLAQETTPVNATEEVNLDENIQAQDLGIAEPNVLPDSPFYFLKNWGRGIRSFFTFNPIKKAELREKFSNEKLIELKKMVEKKKNPKAIKQAADNYQEEVEKIKTITEKIREKAEENNQVEKFLDKFTKHQLLHQRLLQRLENQVPPEALEKIKETRERHLERFGEVMTKLEDREERIKERLEESMEEIKGSKFKNFKNLEVLLELEEKVPERAKEAIRKAQENSLKRLRGDLEKMSPEDRETFKDYLEKIGGVKERQLEILENLKSEIKENPELKENLIMFREMILGIVKERVIGIDCLETEKPDSGFCKEGRIVIKKDEKGCIVSFGCVIPAEIEILPQPEKPGACIALWAPVCGKNGKTYSNACFAKLAGVEIDYKEKCRERECRTDTDCPQLRCGPVGTTNVSCLDMEAKCIEGKCKIKSILPKSESYCRTDFDCACGVKKGTKDCFYGNRYYVDQFAQCPDFCSGIGGNLTIQCIENECQQVSKRTEIGR